MILDNSSKRAVGAHNGRDWTDEQVSWLREAIKTMQSYSLLAAEFNTRFNEQRTRNAVLGKCSRLGIRSEAASRRTVVSKPKADKPAKLRQSPPTAPNAKAPVLSGESFNAKRRLTPEQLAERMAPKPVADIFQDATAASKPLLDCKSDECKWPISDALACGKKITRRSYCAFHAQLAYREPYHRRSKAYEADY